MKNAAETILENTIIIKNPEMGKHFCTGDENIIIQFFSSPYATPKAVKCVVLPMVLGSM
jgi:hypothetical protein